MVRGVNDDGIRARRGTSLPHRKPITKASKNWDEFTRYQYLVNDVFNDAVYDAKYKSVVDDAIKTLYGKLFEFAVYRYGLFGKDPHTRAECSVYFVDLTPNKYTEYDGEVLRRLYRNKEMRETFLYKEKA